ncbi:hypothetical protein M3A49_39730 [Paraburkholderia sp. CNPSo 3076]|uniref:hypothetical protein n=1 Tax=Paraburkholderia sp. CNPSo 3076 TaxID=2940936 RepID=UPI002253A016|nr:hypothetical protein [Paraburkholderia sp. CNPSo 3076]MCX5545491.1 hypothetical protein [Paraburkholderia sp. CNPSo 3076]
MPESARFVDALCDAFGADEIDAIVRQGRDGEPVFYAREAGVEYGTRLPSGRGWNAAALGDRHFCEGCAGKCLETGIRCSEHRARTARGAVR